MSKLNLVKVVAFSLAAQMLQVSSAAAQSNLPSVSGFFNEVNHGNLAEKLAKFYAPDIVFADPIVKITGLSDLQKYYAHTYENVIKIQFDFHDEIVQGDTVFGTWTMKFKHKKINGGEEVSVEGVSHIRFKDGKAVYHRDYFDGGAMIYEHVPLLGGLTRWVKSKAADYQ